MLNFYRPFFMGLGLMVFGATACAQAPAPSGAVQAGKSAEPSNLDRLINSAAVILIAEVETPPQTSNLPATNTPSQSTPDVTIDLKKALDKAREETSRNFTGFDVGALVGLQTIETLKGSKTGKLMIPASTEALKNAKPGQLFVIAMGTQHPDAIRRISSIDDPWVQQIRAALAE